MVTARKENAHCQIWQGIALTISRIIWTDSFSFDGS
jgi:hypothetical protein